MSTVWPAASAAGELAGSGGCIDAGCGTLAPVNAKMNANESAVWRDHIAVPDTPGFTVRTTFPHNKDGVEVMLERWEAGTSEPPHSHPGDDMTVVVEGEMVIQFFTRSDRALSPDGPPVTLGQGDTGYIAAGRIHDAKYVQTCKLVYVHDRAFGFTAEG